MTKLIGITAFTSEHKTVLNTAYVNAFTRAAATPILLPVLAVKNRELMTPASFAAEFKPHIDRYVERLDGLVLSGGQDINPLTFDEVNISSNGCDTIRDYMELALATAFIDAGKPILGICRGHQLLSKMLELPHYQQDIGDLSEHHDGTALGFGKRQEAVHQVYPRGAFREYLTAKVGYDVGAFPTTSFHHQAITVTESGKLPTKLKHGTTVWDFIRDAIDEYEQANDITILATTARVIEAFEKPAAKLVSIQWHPEEQGSEGLTVAYWLDRYLA